jgi:hypothetical protein
MECQRATPPARWELPRPVTDDMLAPHHSPAEPQHGQGYQWGVSVQDERSRRIERHRAAIVGVGKLGILH